MDYFTAVQEGKHRSAKAVDALTQVAGASYPVLFLKTGREDWTPVGDENLCAMVHGKGRAAAVVLCDSEGNAKAISGWISEEDAARVMTTLQSQGLHPYTGEVKLPV